MILGSSGSFGIRVFSSLAQKQIKMLKLFLDFLKLFFMLKSAQDICYWLLEYKNSSTSLT